MSTLFRVTEAEVQGEVKEIIEGIKSSLVIDFVPNLYRTTTGPAG